VKPTSISLLDRLRSARPDDSDWNRMQEIYQPLIRQWLGRVPGLGDDVDDLAQEVFVVVLREIPKFERQREGSFRAWLRQVCVNQVRNDRRKRQRRPSTGRDATEGFLEQLADPQSALSRDWDREHDAHVYHKLLAMVRTDFTPATWQAFRRFALDGLSAARVAEETGLTENAVIQAKSRILRRLRTEAGDLLQ